MAHYKCHLSILKQCEPSAWNHLISLDVINLIFFSFVSIFLWFFFVWVLPIFHQTQFSFDPNVPMIWVNVFTFVIHFERFFRIILLNFLLKLCIRLLRTFLAFVLYLLICVRFLLCILNIGVWFFSLLIWGNYDFYFVSIYRIIEFLCSQFIFKWKYNIRIINNKIRNFIYSIIIFLLNKYLSIVDDIFCIVLLWLWLCSCVCIFLVMVCFVCYFTAIDIYLNREHSEKGETKREREIERGGREKESTELEIKRRILMKTCELKAQFLLWIIEVFETCV